MTANEQIILFLVHNQRQMKEITKPYTDQYHLLMNSENPIFIDDIEKQYLITLRWLLRKEILGLFKDVSIEDACVFVESFDIKEYLK